MEQCKRGPICRAITAVIILVSLMSLLASAFGASGPVRAGPSAAPATVSVTPGTVTAGGQVSITGNGFAPGETINLQLTANPQQTGSLALGTVTADTAGNFALTNLTILVSQPAGSYLVVAIGLFSNLKATTALQVTAPQVPVTVSVNPTSAAAGGMVTISGTGFVPGEAINLQLAVTAQQAGGLQLATITADSSGNFSIANLVVPADQPVGNFVVVATGLTSLRQATIALQVTATQVAATVSVNVASVVAGGPVAISGTGFVPGELIYLTLEASATVVGGLQVGTVTADGSGDFSSATITIPVTTPYGSYLILASDATAGRSATTALQVTATASAISVNPTTFAANSSVTVSGSGFAANEQVTISVNATNGTGSIVVAQVQADGSGNFAATSVHMPFGMAAGAWQVIATGQSSNRQATVGVTVNAQAPTLAVSPNSMLPGADVALSGAYFQPGESVLVSLVGLNATTTLATAQADSSGAFSIGSTAIPLTAAQGAATLIATGNTSRLSATAQITIGATPVTLTLSSGSVVAGGSVGANATGFAPGETVTLQLYRTSVTPLNVGTIVVNASGGFTISAMPIASYLAGTYTISAYGQSSGRVASASVVVQGAPQASPILSIVGGTSNKASPGGLVQVAGANFPANAAITLALSGLGVTTSLGTVSATAGGSFGPGGFTIPITVPSATYSLQATVNGNVLATVTVNVVTLSPTFALSASNLTPGQVVTVKGKGYAAGEQVVLALNGAALATTPSTVLAGSTNAFSAKFVVPGAINNGLNTVTATGASSHASYALTVPGKLPGATTSYYFPNGDTTGGNRTVISVLNTSSAAASLKLTFLYAGAPARSIQQTLPARRQVLIDLNLVAGTNRHLATIVQSSQPIVAGSTIYYYKGDSASPIGASAPATTWYLAEGYTGGSFHEFLEVMNPNTANANVDVRFLPLNGRPPQEHRISLAPRSTISLDTSTYMSKASFSTIVTSDKGVVVERSMRFGTNGRGATAVMGVAVASTVWLFAQGESASNRQTFLTILNPNPASPATVTAAFYNSTGKPVGNTTIAVDPLRRGTIKLNSVLSNASVAMVVTSNVPVVVERPLYSGPSNLDAVSAGEDVFGRNGGSTAWLFPSGDVTGGDQLQLLLFNPSAKANDITATFYTSLGTVIERQMTVPANSATQLAVNGISGLAAGTFGTMLKSSNGQLFVAERRTTNTALGILDGTQGLAQ